SPAIHDRPATATAVRLFGNPYLVRPHRSRRRWPVMDRGACVQSLWILSPRLPGWRYRSLPQRGRARGGEDRGADRRILDEDFLRPIRRARETADAGRGEGVCAGNGEGGVDPVLRGGRRRR